MSVLEARRVSADVFSSLTRRVSIFLAHASGFHEESIHAAELRRRYYSKKNVFSYNDGLYLATGIAEKVDLLITTDPHLLGARDLKTMPPSQYR